MKLHFNPKRAIMHNGENQHILSINNNDMTIVLPKPRLKQSYLNGIPNQYCIFAPSYTSEIRTKIRNSIGLNSKSKINKCKNNIILNFNHVKNSINNININLNSLQSDNDWSRGCCNVLSSKTDKKYPKLTFDVGCSAVIDGLLCKKWFHSVCLVKKYNQNKIQVLKYENNAEEEFICNNCKYIIKKRHELS